MKTNWLFFTLMCRRLVIALSNDRLEQDKALRHDFEDRYVPWNFNQGKNEMKLNDIALANVEALAQYEGLPGYANVEMSWQGGMGGFMQKVCTGSGPKIC